MSTEDPGIIKILLEWAWAGVLGLGALIYRRHEHDMAEVKAGMHTLRNRVATKEELKEHEERETRDREERRASETLLFQKFDALKDEMNAKFDALKTLILEMRR